MMRTLPLRRHLPALAALLVLALLYYHRLAFENRILVGYDALTYFYPNEQYAADALRAGRLPLWNPYLFTGVPFLANLQTAVFYPLNLLFLLLPVPRAFAYAIVLHVLLGAVFAYAFGVAGLRLRPLAALVAAIIYAFSGFFGAVSGHLNQLQASAWLPLLLLLADAVYRQRSLRLAMVGSIVVALQFLAGHMQEFYLSMVALALFVGWQVARDLRAGRRGLPRFPRIFGRTRRTGGSKDPPLMGLEDRDRQCHQESRAPSPPHGRPQRAAPTLREPQLPVLMVKGHQGTGGRQTLMRSALVALMLALGIALAAVQFLPTYELTKESIRGGGMSYAEAASFSLPPWLLLRALLPAHGDPQPFSEWIGYVGVVAVVLAGVALLRSPRHPHAPFFAGLALLALLLALGQFNPLYPLIYGAFPGLSLFRVPARWLLLYTLAVAALGGMGVQAIALPIQGAAQRHWRRLLGRLAVLVLAAGLVLLLFALKLNATATTALPGIGTAILWAAALLAGFGAVALGLRRPGPLGPALAALLVAAELLLAGQGLDLNRVNLPEAYSALRPAIAHLLANPGLYRLLAFSEGTFDPGDLAQLKAMVGPVLPPEGVYDYVVAAKHKETLTPNLPLLFGIPSLDGYDGGVLPLRRYVDLKRLLPLTMPNTPDGRLREQLTAVPNVNLLSWLNVKYVLMDRVRDVWIDGVYYDLGLTRLLGAGGALTLSDPPALQATTIGIVSHLNGGEALPDGAAVARLVVSMRSGAVYTSTIRAGFDTAEGRYGAPNGPGRVAHHEARRATSWRGEPDAWEYVSTTRLPEPGDVKQVQIASMGDAGELALRAVSLIDERRQLSEPVVLDPDLRLSHLGDVKIYENRRALQRAFLVHDVISVARDDDVLSAMQQPDFDPTRRAVLTTDQRADGGGHLSFGAAAVGDHLEMLDYRPEEVHVATESKGPALLVLTDSYYPGWRATVDGRPAPLLRADYLFRAVALPAGAHQVAFYYEPDSLRLGAGISLATLVLVLIGLCRPITNRALSRR